MISVCFCSLCRVPPCSNPFLIFGFLFLMYLCIYLFYYRTQYNNINQVEFTNDKHKPDLQLEHNPEHQPNNWLRVEAPWPIFSATQPFPDPVRDPLSGTWSVISMAHGWDLWHQFQDQHWWFHTWCIVYYSGVLQCYRFWNKEGIYSKNY